MLPYTIPVWIVVWVHPASGKFRAATAVSGGGVQEREMMHGGFELRYQSSAERKRGGSGCVNASEINVQSMIAT